MVVMPYTVPKKKNSLNLHIRSGCNGICLDFVPDISLILCLLWSGCNGICLVFVPDVSLILCLLPTLPLKIACISAQGADAMVYVWFLCQIYPLSSVFFLHNTLPLQIINIVHTSAICNPVPFTQSDIANSSVSYLLSHSRPKEVIVPTLVLCICCPGPVPRK